MEIIKNEGFSVVKSDPAVAVLCYSLSPEGSIAQLGIVDEKFPFSQNGRIQGIVAGKLEKTDRTLMSRAKAELTEESGYTVEDPERWMYLGEFNRGKVFNTPIYCFAVDVTGLDRSEPQGDGSPNEADIRFEMKDLAEALEIRDTLVHACFFNLFRNLFKTHFQ